jgi:hypothetical protein
MNAPIVLRDFSGVPEITQDAYALKETALAAAKPVKKVESEPEQLVAVNALKQLKAIRTGIELSRKAVKSPVIELGRKIDDIAYSFLAECDKEEMRLQGLINHYQRKELERKRAEEQKLQQTEKKAEELEQEANELRHRAVFEKDKDSRDAMLKRAGELDARVFDAKMIGEVTAMPEATKPKGLVIRNRINFQVTDPIVFAQAWPQFWKWNKDTETLKLDRMGILDELNKESGNGIFHKTKFPEELSATDDARLVRPAGLRVYEETKSHVR